MTRTAPNELNNFPARYGKRIIYLNQRKLSWKIKTSTAPRNSTNAFARTLTLHLQWIQLSSTIFPQRQQEHGCSLSQLLNTPCIQHAKHSSILGLLHLYFWTVILIIYDSEHCAPIDVTAASITNRLTNSPAISLVVQGEYATRRSGSKDPISRRQTRVTLVTIYNAPRPRRLWEIVEISGPTDHEPAPK